MYFVTIHLCSKLGDYTTYLFLLFGRTTLNDFSFSFSPKTLLSTERWNIPFHI